MCCECESVCCPQACLWLASARCDPLTAFRPSRGSSAGVSGLLCSIEPSFVLWHVIIAHDCWICHLHGACLAGRSATAIIDYASIHVSCRVKHAAVMEWIWFVNSHDQFFYSHLHGDKDTFQLAFHLAGQEDAFQQVTKPPGEALSLRVCCQPLLLDS